MVDRLKILVVEDDPIYAHFVATALRGAGHEVTIAVSVASAFERAREDPPGAVVLDLRLPDGNGYALASRLRREVLDPSAIMIILTSELHPKLDPAYSADVDLVLTKPVEDELVNQLVEHVRQRRQLRLRTRR